MLKRLDQISLYDYSVSIATKVKIMIKKPLILRVFIFCILLVLVGCAGTREERKQMKAMGQALFNKNSQDCYDVAWTKHPANFQTVAVTKWRSRQIHTGMQCIEDDDSAGRENCSNTYRNEPEYYTVQDTKDLNKGYRDNFYGSCLTRKCNEVIGASARDEGFTTLQGQKYSYCRQGR